MEDLQATVEIAVDLGRLSNVDLFQRGYYRVSVKLIEPAYPHSKVEVIKLTKNDSNYFLPSKVLDDGVGAVSKCLQVLYKREECYFNHTFLFRVHCLLDSQKIMESLKKYNFVLEIALYFTNGDEDVAADICKSMQEVSKRTLKLELDLMYGLFANTLVLFDYGFMAAVELSVHASLVALHQPLMTMPSANPNSKSANIEPSTLESILFRPLPGMSVGQADDFNVRMSNAISVHAKLVKILLTVYGNMQNYYIKLLKTLPKKKQEHDVLSNMQQVSSRLFSRDFQPDLDSLVIETLDITTRLSNMTAHLQKMHSLEELVNQVNMNLASTCSLLLGLWSHVIETSCQNSQVRKQLAVKYHKHRVERFRTSFFTMDNPRNPSFDDSRCSIYNSIASEVRSSKYFTELPVLPIQNDVADGAPESLPVIFEDIYKHQCKKEPVFRQKSSGLFSRSGTPTTSQTPATQQNGIARVHEEIGREIPRSKSPSGSVSSCGEAVENMVLSKDENPKKKKYSGILRKRRGSYKVKDRTEKTSVSDDESIKFTLAEFLSSMDNPKPTTLSSESKSSTASSSSSSKSKSSDKSKHSKSKTTANNVGSGKAKKKKRRSFLQHRRSLDDGAQRLLQRIRAGKRNSDGTGRLEEDKEKALSRSYSSSALSTAKPSSSSYSLSSLESNDDINCCRSTDDMLASSNRTRPLMRSLTANANHRAENRFMALLRSETYEEPESGISVKPVALSARNPFLSSITVTTSAMKAPPNSPTKKETVKAASEKSTRNGLVKSQSYSVGIAQLQNGSATDQQFSRPHENYVNAFPCGQLKTSHTTLGGLDRVRYGIGLHPGGGTATTSDLSPFDEPEQIQAWGELSSRTNILDIIKRVPRNLVSEESLSSQSDSANRADVTTSEESSPFRSDSASGTEATSQNLVPVSSSPFKLGWVDGMEGEKQDSVNERNSPFESENMNGIDFKQQDIVTNGSPHFPSDGEGLVQSHDDTLTTENGMPLAEKLTDFDATITNDVQDEYLGEKCTVDEFFRDAHLSEPGSFFFNGAASSGVQGSALPDDVILLNPPKSHSLIAFAGSLDCSEEPADDDFLNELEALNDRTLRDAVFEPEPVGYGLNGNELLQHKEVNENIGSTLVNNANSSNPSTVKETTSSAVSKVNSKRNFNAKLPQLVGDISLDDVEAALTTSINIFNAIPSLRKQRQKSYFQEKGKLLDRLQFPGALYSDIPAPVISWPYLDKCHSISRLLGGCDHHLVVCVHGLDGNCNDLRLVKTYLQLAAPVESNLTFLMSRSNQDNTYADIETMAERLVSEIYSFIDSHYSVGRHPTRISFIGHSLGCLLIRSAVAHEKMSCLKSRFHTFLSFSGPHLGTVFNNSALVNTGLWIMQKWKKSTCLLQLSCKDHSEMRKTYLYKLSKKKGLEYFRNVVLVASAADRYVPYHSARIEMCKQAFRDKSLGPPYQEMWSNLMKPVLSRNKLNLVRYHVVHSLPGTNANTVIGRAAHIAVLDSEIFLEKFFLVAGLRFFV